MIFWTNLLDKLKSVWNFLKQYITITIDKDKLKEDGLELIKKKTGISLKKKDPDKTKAENYTQDEISDDKQTISDNISNLDKRDLEVNSIDYSKYKGIQVSGNTSNPTILIVDDLDFIIKLYKSDFNSIKRDFNKDIDNDYCIKFATGPDCGFIAINEINNNDNIKFALLDITLGSVAKNSAGEFIELDGVDIAIHLLKQNPHLDFLFVSGHTMNRLNPNMNKYYKKFEDKTGLNIENYYLYKNSDRYKVIYERLYKEEIHG